MERPGDLSADPGALGRSLVSPDPREVSWLTLSSGHGLSALQLEQAHALADAARVSRWAEVLDLLGNDSERVNAARPGGMSGYTPLHQAAHGGAPLEVVEALIERGALRTLRTVAGERAVDLARRLGHVHLVELLEPQPLLELPADKLAQVEAGVHRVMWERQEAQSALERLALRLPPLEILTEIPGHRLWFQVPYMGGGFHLHLGRVADEPVCLVDSWNRMAWGSEERRLVSTGGVTALPWG